MVDIDPLTGLPKELLAMEEIVREQQSIKVHIEKRRYGKLVTLINGVGKGVDINDLAKQLKTKCATGGTAKGGVLAAIAKEFPTPLRFIGVGEGIDDLREFNAKSIEAFSPSFSRSLSSS